MPNDWCDVDDCPSSLCKGPHVAHDCGGSVVTIRVDDRCPFCGTGRLNEGDQ